MPDRDGERMKAAPPQPVYRRDYRAPAYWIDRTWLDFQLYEDHVLVESRLQLRRNPQSAAAAVLELHGCDLVLLELALDGRSLTPQDYELTPDLLRLPAPAERFELRSVTRLLPQQNTALEGLYQSRVMLCTQCEAEGFRKITWYLDRPDVMSVFSVRIEADAASCPVLLSNGNCCDAGVLGSRHWVLWQDPFPKPAYLFALVAGRLDCVEDRFITRSGREVALKIFVESGDLDKCGHAMQSLQRAMRWDEQAFGREYDLDVFNIVAVDDFNMGAMENKSLNIFNTACVLAQPDIATDMAFQRIEAVVAHEYFHNWSGNRVTCRDWFQLSLKEGFTVYREAAFCAAMGAPVVKRIGTVAQLCDVQFAEDAGPLAHPVRPDSYIEIANFYTATIYEKGAEVVGMLHSLLGAGPFRRGSDLYFERHDGQAVTCDDFVQAMADASGRDLSQFRRWYSQVGTPHLQVSDSWDAERGSYYLRFRQSGPAPLHIPVQVGLLGRTGPLPLQLQGQQGAVGAAADTSMVLELTRPEQSFCFTRLTQRPVPSLLRGFSAPVKLQFDYSQEQLAFIMRHDEDGFCRWNAARQLAIAAITAARSGPLPLDSALLEALADLLAERSLDAGLVAEMLRLPGENTLAELAQIVDVEAIHRGRERLRGAIADALQERLLQRYRDLGSAAAYAPSPAQIAARSLRNSCLAYLALTGADGIALARQQFATATNMTDRQAALTVLVDSGNEDQREQALEQFYRDWQDQPLVVNQWFQVQACCARPGNPERVRALLQHPAFQLRNPNKVRSLIGAFCTSNPINFHRADGAGYALLVEVVSELNSLNPQIAARLLTPLTRWQRYAARGQQMRAALREVGDLPNVSKDVFEVVSKALA